MKVYIGFSRHKTGILSSLIRKVQGTEYSHVYIRRDSKYGEYVYQASGLQVNFMNINTFLEANVVCEEYEFDIPEDKHDDLIRFCIKYAGKPYGTKQLIKMCLKELGFKVSKGDKDESFVCSELGGLFCHDILKMDIPGDQDFITPKDLNKYIKMVGKKRHAS